MSDVLRIALTGGIGCGKSTVASLFQKHGAPIIDSDVISRDLVKPDKPCFRTIINEFGTSLESSEGTLDRDKLRNIIFNNEEKKKILEEILHPIIYQEIEEQVSKINYPYCLIVIPLLIETKAMDRFDRILLIDISENLQIERASTRDNATTQNIENIIKNQATRKQRLQYADDVIDNNIKIEELNETVLKLHDKYLNLKHYNN